METKPTAAFPSFPPSALSIQDLNGIESVFAHKDPPIHCISQFYRALIDLQNSQYPAYLTKWEDDLGSTISDKKKDKILHLAHISSIASTMAESNYKLLTRWHHTPAKLHRIFQVNSPLCWRNCGEIATHAHIWWSCPILRPIWSKVVDLIHQITDVLLPLDPWIILLSRHTKPIGRYKRSLIPHMLNTANTLIPTLWSQPTIPSMKTWLQKISKVNLMQELTHIARGTIERHTLTWAPWSSFLTSSCYKDIISLTPEFLTTLFGSIQPKVYLLQFSIASLYLFLS